MLFCLQIALYCLLFFLLVKCAVKNDGRNCLYFYPTAYIDEAQRRGLAEHGDVMRRGKRFMIPFCAVMLIALVLIVGVWNRASTFCAAYAQKAIFLVVMNWFDGIVIDRLWVGHSKIWRIEGMEGVPYVKPWKNRAHKARARDGALPAPLPRLRRHCPPARQALKTGARTYSPGSQHK